MKFYMPFDSKKPLVLNLYGGPGCGKSTIATRLFSELKTMNVRCEYVSEYAKDVTYAEDWNKLADQLYITAKQNRKMNIVADKVDLVITDCPILLGRHYAPVEYFNGVFGELVMQIYNSYDNINILLNRKKQYQSYGRSQTEEEAKEIDGELEYLLISHDIPFEKFDGTFDSIDGIVKLVLEKLKSRRMASTQFFCSIVIWKFLRSWLSLRIKFLSIFCPRRSWRQ